MSISMFRRALKDIRWTVTWYALGLGGYGLAMIAFYPSIEKMYADMMKSYPKDMLKVLGTREVSNTLAGFLGAEFLNIIWPIIAAVFLIMAGTAVVAREVESGTVEFWLSVPVSRTKLLAGKMAALFIGAFVLVVATAVTLALGAWLISHPFSGGNMFLLGLNLLSLSVAIAGYSILFSAALSSRARAAGAAAGLTFVFYLAFVVSAMNESWRWLEHFTIFAGFGPQQALENGALSVAGIGALMTLAAVCAGAALLIFQRRELVA